MNLLRDTRKHRKKRSMKHRSVKSKKHRGVKSRNIKNTKKKNKYSGGYYKPDPETMPSKEYGIRSPDEYFVIVDPGTYEDSTDPRKNPRKITLDKPTDGVIDGWMIGGGYSVTLIDDEGVTNKRISIYGNLFNKVHQKFPTSNV